MSSRGLTPKQQRFVSEYLLDLNATAAARRAGYSARNADKIGPRLVGQSRVAAAIAAKKAERAAKSDLTAAWVLRRLAEEADLKGDGATHAARVRALELLAKHLGLLTEHLRLSGQVATPPAPVDLSALSDDQLRQLNALLALAAPAGHGPALPPPGD